MRTVTAALIALAAAPAAAETATSVGTACEVRFVRAPEDVRHVIESWLAAEPHCQSSIDLRVLPITDGYYLLAKRPDGRLHERVVPDAQAAGVLVASWVADDWTEEPPRPPPVAPQPVIVEPSVGQENIVGASAAPRSAPRSRWLTMSALIRIGGGGGGLRGEIDALRWGAWSLAAGVSLTQAYYTGLGDDGTWSFGADDFKAIALVTRTSTFRRLQLRLAAGAGVMHTSSSLRNYSWSSGDASPPPHEIVGIGEAAPVAELGASLALRVGENWAIHGGVVATFVNNQVLLSHEGMSLVERQGELMFTTGLRYAL